MARWRSWVLAGALVSVPMHAQAHPGLSKQIDDLTQRIATDRKDTTLRLKRARLYRELEHFDDAAADLRRVARIDPQSDGLLLERGLLFAAKGKTTKADRDLSAYLARNDSAEALTARGKIRSAAGRHAEARADFDAAIALRPTPDLYLARGRLDVELGELDRAATGYAAGVETLGGYPITMALIDVEKRRGEARKALELLDGLLAKTPEQPAWLTLRAELLDVDGQPALAAVARLLALSIADARLAARPTTLRRLDRAKVYLAIGIPQHAVPELERVAAEAPNLPEVDDLLRAARHKESTQ